MFDSKRRAGQHCRRKDRGQAEKGYVFVVIGLCQGRSFRVAISSSFSFPRFPAGGAGEEVEIILELYGHIF